MLLLDLRSRGSPVDMHFIHLVADDAIGAYHIKIIGVDYIVGPAVRTQEGRIIQFGLGPVIYGSR